MEKMTRDDFIDSAANIKKEIKEKQDEDVSKKQILNVMKKDCELSYRKIKRISVHSNSEKNLVLRQRFALEMIKFGNQKKVLLNIDETWLGMSDFRKMKWRVKGSTNSVPMFEI
jgi:hypothetical protein